MSIRLHIHIYDAYNTCCMFSIFENLPFIREIKHDIQIYTHIYTLIYMPKQFQQLPICFYAILWFRR